MAVTSDQIKALRELTDAPIQDCKAALEATQGDQSKAQEELKKMGKASVRTVIPTAGAIGICQTESSLAMVVAKSETDFVSRNEKFIDAANIAAEMLTEGEDANVFFKEATMPFKENCLLAEGVLLPRPEGHRQTYYLHYNKQRAVAIEFTGEGSVDDARKVGAHIAANCPPYIKRESIAQEVIDEMSAEFKAACEAEGKPERAIPDIVQGKVKKKLAEIVLYEQPWYADPKQTVGQFCASANIDIVTFKSLTV